MKSPRSRKRKQSRKGKVGGRRRVAKVSRMKPAATTPHPLDEFITGAARQLGLQIEPGWMGAVRANLELTLALGAQVGAFALPDDAEPAPVFRA